MRRFVPYVFAALLAVVAGLAFSYIHTSGTKDAGSPILYYEDPMHPAYRSAHPGIAPDCGMKLVPVYADRSVQQKGPPPRQYPATLQITPDNQHRYGIGLTQVELSSGENIIRAVGRVAADETRIYRLNIGAAGFVKTTHDDAVGNKVHKNQRLATIYSAELQYAVSGFLAGNGRIPSDGMRETAPTQSATNSQSRVEYLRGMGMSDSQIDQLREKRKIPEEIYIASPADGFILSRTLSQGMRFEKDAELYRIVDLSSVWIVAEVFGKDAASFRPGMIAQVKCPDLGVAFRARVSNAPPEIDPTTRTYGVRLEVSNPHSILRPGMFVNVELPIRLPAGISVPAGTVLDAGLSKHVFVASSPSSFEERVVQTGWRSNDRIQIVKGLNPGDQVVSSGTFLVDSESRLHADGSDLAMSTSAGNP